VMAITITRAGPLLTLQDAGRFGMLVHGISASGPMDRSAFEAAGARLERVGRAALEFTTAGVAFVVDGRLGVGCAGGAFQVTVNGHRREWPARLGLDTGDVVEITPGPAGNYGYLRFDRELALAPVLGSWSTNLAVGLGGYKGRALRAGDRLELGDPGGPSISIPVSTENEGPIRVLWGLHADEFSADTREAFVRTAFTISANLDRMGVRLLDPTQIFRSRRRLTLVSDAIVPGDIQVLGDGAPTVLMRDHQPTGGYPRIATVVTADLDRFAQLRPGTEVRFRPVSLEHAR
jgi:biotin-dependent carboxylase-like uncharacterized protein